MMKCALLLIICSTLLSISATNWDDFRATWPTFSNLPQTQMGARSHGWIEDTFKQCNNGSAQGFRFWLPNDNYLDLFLLFNIQGHISGIQVASETIPPTSTFPPFGPWAKDTVNWTTVYTLTMYFRDPSTICSGTDSGSQIGDGLWFYNGINTTIIPQGEQNLPLGPGTWGKGQCIVTMGNHYWYNVDVNSDCDTILPLFLLYNQGQLNGFGWLLAWGDSQPGPRWEHPTSTELSYVLAENQIAKCFADTGRNFNTMHFYLSNPNWDEC